MPELAETQLETPSPAPAEPVARIEDDEDEDSDDTIPELEDAGLCLNKCLSPFGSDRQIRFHFDRKCNNSIGWWCNWFTR